MALRYRSDFLFLLVALVVVGVLSAPLLAQGPLADPSDSSVEPATPVVIAPVPSEVHQRFWDRANIALFSANATMSGADFAITRANLQSGGQELNPVVRIFGRSTPALAANFVGEAAAVVSISYLFHKTGHHKLERAISMVNLSGSAGAVTYDLIRR